MPNRRLRAIRIASAFPAALAAITLLACGDAAMPTPILESTPVSIVVAPSELTLVIGGSGRVFVQAVDSKARPVGAIAEWSAGDPAIVTVGKSDGIVHAVSVGTTFVTAVVGSLKATAVVTVQPPPHPAGLSISAPTLSLIIGGAVRLTARAYDSTGQEIGASFEWSSSNTDVVIVSKLDGVATAVAVGSASIKVTSGAITETASVSVTPLASFSFARETWSDDGRRTTDVLLFSPTDRTIESLTRESEFRFVTAPAWSSDGMRLAVEVIQSYQQPPNAAWIDYTSDLYVLHGEDPTGTSWRALTSNGLSASPIWSPNGQRIAYLQQTARLNSTNDIYIVDADGGTPVRVTSKSSNYGRPSWSPDGTRLVFTESVLESSVVFIVNANGSGLTRVTYEDAFDVDPSWSPDGKRIALISSRESTPSRFQLDVFVMDVDGANAKRLTSLSDYGLAPTWSPDGRHILFASGRSLYVMNADGTSQVRVTTPPFNSFDSAPAWRR